MRDVEDYRLDPPEYSLPVCPWCGEECETFYFDKAGTLIGCENCITTEDAVEYVEEM